MTFEVKEFDAIEIAWSELAEMLADQGGICAGPIEPVTVINNPRERKIVILVRDGIERVPERWRRRERIPQF